MKKNFFVILLATTVIYSCTPNDLTDIVVPGKPKPDIKSYVPSKEVNYHPFAAPHFRYDSLEYLYDTQNRIIEEKRQNVIVAKYQYNGQNLIKAEIVGGVTRTFAYVGNTIVESVAIDKNTTPYLKYTYVLNNKQQIIERREHTNSSNPTETYKYDSTGNLSERKNSQYDYEVTTYKYDNKPHPFANVKTNMFLLKGETSINNLIEEAVLNENVPQREILFQLSYKYNANNLPFEKSREGLTMTDVNSHTTYSYILN